MSDDAVYVETSMTQEQTYRQKWLLVDSDGYSRAAAAELVFLQV